MVDVLAIYNLAVKFPNTVDLVREVEKMARAETIEEIKEIIDNGCNGTECSECEYRINHDCEDCFIINKIEDWLEEQKNDKR